MFQLAWILVFVLEFTAGAGGIMEHYTEPGRDVILPCGSASSSDKCGSVTWLYNKDNSNTLAFVLSGKIMNKNRIPRPSLGHDCSLVIKNITAEDIGLFTCRIGNVDSSIHLNLLTISLTPPDADPKRDGKVTLQCSLTVYAESGLFQHHSVRWMNETGTVLLGEGVGYRLERQTNCLSVLTVWPHGGRDRKYTCQVVDGQNRVKAESSYTPVFRRETEPIAEHAYGIIVGAVVGVVVVLLLLAAVLITCRRRNKVEGSHGEHDVEKRTQQPDEPDSSLTYITFSHSKQGVSPKKMDEPDSSLTYITFSHSKQGASPKQMVKEEEEVTYSTVKIPQKTETDYDPSSLFSGASESK